ncbi:MAG: hypothetical protein HIU88_12670 [Acidobacteria bacterium]|nr:hypothetical protein [Acidobacteriota bacterium]
MNRPDLRVRSLALLGLSSETELGDRVTEIGAGDEGVWMVWTLSQTIYLVQWTTLHRELVRFPRWETVWISDDTGQEIQLDARPLPIVELVRVRVGERGQFRVDTGQPGRDNSPLHSTPIVAIFQLPTEPA